METANFRKHPLFPKASDWSISSLYETIAAKLPIGFSLVDQDGLILDFNPAAEKITGFLKRDIQGKPHLEIIHGTSDPKSCPLYTHAFEQRTASIATESVLKRKDGEWITLSFTIFPLTDESGNFIGGVELFRDITEIKRKERERKNFLSMFAHDMKNPIVIGEGYLVRMLSGKVGALTETQKEYLMIIKEQTQKLQRLVSDFLDFSRVEKSDFSPVLESYNLEEAIGKHLEIMRTAADKKNIHLFFDYAQESLPVIPADAALMDRVLTNLLDNAIKYTPPGGTVKVHLLNRVKDILVEVEDTGIGIYEKDLPCVFDAFCRIDRTGEGSGLGLAIARAIMTAHEGTISVESTPGKGSIFRLTLPKN
ncbi:MAG: PAS domain S-box protein [Deltaproteobacteria bacterium]|nr:PAS domain S-box protein [Deltaproteobacteria bacterium]